MANITWTGEPVSNQAWQVPPVKDERGDTLSYFQQQGRSQDQDLYKAGAPNDCPFVNVGIGSSQPREEPFMSYKFPFHNPPRDFSPKKAPQTARRSK